MTRDDGRTSVGDTDPAANERAARDDQRLTAWEQRTNPLIIAAAVLPIVVGLTEKGQSEPAVWLDLGSWAIFIADFVVHIRLRRGYLRSGVGIFDASIVVLTAPWYLIPGFGATRVLGIARLGRLGRVFIASTKSKVLNELGRRLGHAALYGFVLMLCCALVVMAVEPASSGFDTFGDSMWWAIVTFTTVGYGDLVPVTTGGRLAGVLLMLGGVALIGTLAASLGSFFSGGGDKPSSKVEPDPQVELLAEVKTLRAEIEELRRSLPPAR